MEEQKDENSSFEMRQDYEYSESGMIYSITDIQNQLEYFKIKRKQQCQLLGVICSIKKAFQNMSDNSGKQFAIDFFAINGKFILQIFTNISYQLRQLDNNKYFDSIYNFDEQYINYWKEISKQTENLYELLSNSQVKLLSSIESLVLILDKVDFTQYMAAIKQNESLPYASQYQTSNIFINEYSHLLVHDQEFQNQGGDDTRTQIQFSIVMKQLIKKIEKIELSDLALQKVFKIIDPMETNKLSFEQIDQFFAYYWCNQRTKSKYLLNEKEERLNFDWQKNGDYLSIKCAKEDLEWRVETQGSSNIGTSILGRENKGTHVDLPLKNDKSIARQALQFGFVPNFGYYVVCLVNQNSLPAMLSLYKKEERNLYKDCVITIDDDYYVQVIDIVNSQSVQESSIYIDNKQNATDGQNQSINLQQTMDQQQMRRYINFQNEFKPDSDSDDTQNFKKNGNLVEGQILEQNNDVDDNDEQTEPRIKDVSIKIKIVAKEQKFSDEIKQKNELEISGKNKSLNIGKNYINDDRFKNTQIQIKFSTVNNRWQVSVQTNQSKIRQPVRTGLILKTYQEIINGRPSRAYLINQLDVICLRSETKFYEFTCETIKQQQNFSNMLSEKDEDDTLTHNRFGEDQIDDQLQQY